MFDMFNFFLLKVRFELMVDVFMLFALRSLSLIPLIIELLLLYPSL